MSRGLIKLLILFMTLCTSLCVWGQNKNQYTFDHLTIQDGLSHNSVTSIIQDRYGFMWIGTKNGLNRYDGYSFRIYNSEQSCREKCFRGKSIFNLLEDRAGNLWVGTEKSGINIKYSGQDHFVNLDSIPGVVNLEGKAITSLHEDGEGYIWIGLNQTGVLRFDPKQNSYKLYTAEENNLLRNSVFSITSDKKGQLFVKTAGYGLNVLRAGDQFEHIHEDKMQGANMMGYRSALQIDNDYLWIGMEGTGLYKMHLETKHFEHYTDYTNPINIVNNAALDILLSKDNLLYVAIDGAGLGVFDQSRQNFNLLKSNLDDDQALNTNSLQCLYEDRSENIWIGTFNGGVNLIKKNKPRFRKLNPLSDEMNMNKLPSVLSMIQDSAGLFWFGTDGEGLIQYNQKSGERKLFSNKSNQESIRSNVVKSLLEANSQELWVGLHAKGLNTINKNRDEISGVYNNDVEYQNVWTIEELNDEQVLIGTIGGGLFLIEQGHVKDRFLPEITNPSSIASTEIMEVYKDRDGNVWIGNRSEGLDLWNQTSNAFEHFDHDQNDNSSISDNEIRCIFQDSKSRLWIGTEGGGLNLMLTDKSFQHFGVNEGLIADNIQAIEEDDNGFLWLSSFIGISRFNPDTKEIVNYNFREKGRINQFNQVSILKDKEGILYFGGINGIDVIDPSETGTTEASGKILFSEFRIFDQLIEVGTRLNDRTYLEKPLQETKKIKLYHTDNSFTISFTENNFSGIDAKYQYKLDGFNDSWKNTNKSDHGVSYTNLDYGTYTFRVKNKHSSAKIEIKIVAPFWDTWWFKIGLSMSILLSGFYLLRLLHYRRIDQEKQKLLEKEKEQLVSKNVTLEESVNDSNSKLLSSTAQMAHKNEILLDIKEDIKALQLNPEKNVGSIIRKLDLELKNEDFWKEFNIYFEKVDKKFTDEILNLHPDLTQNDLKICTFIRLNLNTKDIANLLNISVRGVEKGRYRLKKRLQLSSEQDLIQYIRSIHPEEA
ncbi:hypothetical protein N9B82_02140 [Saprospiraceae bacterium]|nr:hypothetical protein [Saprospiraceae bacterium]